MGRLADLARTGAPAAFALAATILAVSTAHAAAPCRNTERFDNWLADFKKEALAQGISRKAIAEASPYLAYEHRIIRIDRGQRFFAQNFLQFSKKLIMPYRLSQGRKLIKKHAALFARVEREFGVPAPVIVGFWGLESDFGSNMGKDRTIRSLATLAYDCRRGEMFRGHLFNALRLIERGDLSARQMIGSWAGELGQIQMMPSEYLKHAIDYDGDGHRNLLRSKTDVIGSAGNFLRSLGWRRGEPWLEEVRVPGNLDWKQADLAIEHPRSQWAQWGVTQRNGEPLPQDDLRAALLLPMGRRGPAFLAYPNFRMYIKWNNSLTYALTAAYYATRLDGAPKMNRGARNIPSISYEQTKELQRLLARAGYDVGPVDGKIGAQTRAAVKKAQLDLGLPADSYPTPNLIRRMRNRR